MTMQIFVIVLAVVVFVVSCNWFFPAYHKSVLVLFLFTCILYCIAFLLLREAFLRMRIPSYSEILLQGIGARPPYRLFGSCMPSPHITLGVVHEK